MKIIVYTFKSFPYKATLRQCFPNYFEFGKLKQSLIAFQQIIDKQKPKYILGIAKSNTGKSRFETLAINKFTRYKQVDKQGKKTYPLLFPKKRCLSVASNGDLPTEARYNNIQIAKTPNYTFCNWTMYKISQCLENKKCKLLFVHVAKKDIALVKDYTDLLD